MTLEQAVLSFFMFLLVKVPCILVAMVGLQVAITPPHPPPTNDEKAESTKMEAALKQRSAPILVKVRSVSRLSFILFSIGDNITGNFLDSCSS